MHIHIYNPSTSPPSLLAQVAAVHAACTTADPRAIATWRPPFTPQRLEAMTAWYADMLAPSATYGCMRGVPDALLASTSASTSTSAPAPAQDAKGPFAHLNTLILMLHPDGQRVAGFVILARALSESGPQRATVRMLSVDPELRRAGVARGLMAELERIAKSEGRWLLTLATARQSNAYAYGVYPAYGYTQWGVIEDYVVNPGNEQLMAEANFFKDLRMTSPLQAKK